MKINKEREFGEFYNESFESYCENLLRGSIELVLNGQFGEMLDQFEKYLKSTPPDKRGFSIFVPELDDAGKQKTSKGRNGNIRYCHDIYFALQNGVNVRPHKALLYDSLNQTGRAPSKWREIDIEPI